MDVFKFQKLPKTFQSIKNSDRFSSLYPIFIKLIFAQGGITVFSSKCSKKREKNVSQLKTYGNKLLYEYCLVTF